MQGYQQKMKLAQQSKGICYGSGQTVGRMPLKQLLSINNCIPTKFQVPIFQRRYCWTETQWQTLLMDAATTSQVHSLGRLTCTNSSLEDERSVILDGQQRFTTVTLLLAAIRDTLYKRLQRSKQNNTLRWLDPEQASKTIAEINQILFPDQDAYQQWINKSTPQLEEGIELPFAKLIPTYCDRWSYYSAILPQHLAIANRLLSSQKSFHRPLAAKQYYNGMLSTFSNGEVFHLLDGIYHKLTMLVFPIETTKAKKNQSEYGTDDLMVVYERLAIRDATWCVPTRHHEYVTMSGLDMIRNALLGNLDSPSQALEFYQAYWLPMERMAAASVTSTSGGEEQDQQQQEEEEGNLQAMMNAFFDQENLLLQEEEEKLEEGTVGGLLYVRFQLWQDKQFVLAAASSGASNKKAIEEATRQQGQTMLAFAQDYFQSSSSSS
jgi:hypothetical protein